MKKFAAFILLLVCGLHTGAQTMQQGSGKLIRQGDGTFIYVTARSWPFYSLRLMPNGDINDAYHGERTSKKTYGHLVNTRATTAQQDKWNRLLIGGSACKDSSSPRMATMVRLTRIGDADADFTPVIAQVKAGDSSEFIGIYLLPDEKIMGVGICYAGGVPRLFFSRFQYNGDADLSFGSGGMLMEEGDSLGFRPVLSVAQKDGRCVTAGILQGKEGIVVRRFFANGVEDSAYDNCKALVTAKDGSRLQPVAMLLQPDGKILLAGNSVEKDLQTMFIARLDTNGKADTSFGTDGRISISVTGQDRMDDIALLHDGQIVMCGAGRSKGGAVLDRYLMMRFSPQGKIDKQYGYGSPAGLAPIAEVPGHTALANRLAITPRSNKVNRVRELDGGSDPSTLLYFITYLHDAELGIMDVPVGKLQNFIYPIGVKGGLKFSFDLIEELDVTVKLQDADGREISTIKEKAHYPEGENSVVVTFPAGSKPGRYFVVLSSDAGYKITVVLTKI